jgi:DNA-binding GntR family transcriptional regulator
MSRASAAAERVDRVSVADAAYADLRDAIATGRIAAGTILSESRVAADLEISRTPVRQALRRLDLEGHIERDARGRPIVHALTGRELAEIFTVRELLEGFGARLAATRISDVELDQLSTIVELDWVAHRRGDVVELARLNKEFHGVIMVASRNRALVEIVDELQWRVFGLSAFAVGTRDDSEHFVSEHARMLDLLRDGDASAVESLVHRHLRAAHRVLGPGTAVAAHGDVAAHGHHDGREDERIRIA